jgi:hypothetical protein
MVAAEKVAFPPRATFSRIGSDVQIQSRLQTVPICGGYPRPSRPLPFRPARSRICPALPPAGTGSPGAPGPGAQGRAVIGRFCLRLSANRCVLGPDLSTFPVHRAAHTAAAWCAAHPG